MLHKVLVRASVLKLARSVWGGSVANKISIPWPHEHCHIGPERKKVLYDELNHGQWSAGLFATVALETDQRARGNMLVYCTQLAQDAVDCGLKWPMEPIKLF